MERVVCVVGECFMNITCKSKYLMDVVVVVSCRNARVAE
jgi:hypothetical protein